MADMKNRLLVVLILITMITLAPITAFADDYGVLQSDGVDDYHIDDLIGSDASLSVEKGSLNISSAGSYTYTIYPLLEPLNEYYFVKSDNPDPDSFRFRDVSSKYSENAYIVCAADRFADVAYDDVSTGRVNGGYIFVSTACDGGRLVVQQKNSSDKWTDTDKSLSISERKDYVDYLISRFATKDDFFDNLTAVKDGMMQIGRYSGPYVAGQITKVRDYWMVTTSPFADQTFYIYSPYGRANSEYLFATHVYPFIYHSTAFPSVIAEVSQRLDSSSTYEYGSVHYNVSITYKGEKRVYGGACEGNGYAISKNQIKKTYTFKDDGAGISLDNSLQLLKDYGTVKAPDDMPAEEGLTFEDIYNTLDGASGDWVTQANVPLMNNGGVSTGEPHFSFFYRKGKYDSVGSVGTGDLGTLRLADGYDLAYAKDAWVDGRYVDEFRTYVKGAKFEKHPHSRIILRNTPIPQVRKDSATSRYFVEVVNKTALFVYDDESGGWVAATGVFKMIA